MSRSKRFRKCFWIIPAAGLALLLFLLLCGDPPMGHTTKTNSADYRRANAYVTRTLSQRTAFRGLLPEQVPEGGQVRSYFYSYDCALLSDAVFSFWLDVAFQADEDYSRELQRIAALGGAVYSPGNETIYFISGSPEDIRGFLDEEVRDGVLMRLEIARVHPGEKRIEYLTAQLYEGLLCREEVRSFLEEVEALPLPGSSG